MSILNANRAVITPPTIASLFPAQKTAATNLNKPPTVAQSNPTPAPLSKPRLSFWEVLWEGLKSSTKAIVSFGSTLFAGIKGTGEGLSAGLALTRTTIDASEVTARAIGGLFATLDPTSLQQAQNNCCQNATLTVNHCSNTYAEVCKVGSGTVNTVLHLYEASKHSYEANCRIASATAEAAKATFNFGLSCFA